MHSIKASPCAGGKSVPRLDFACLNRIPWCIVLTLALQCPPGLATASGPPAAHRLATTDLVQALGSIPPAPAQESFSLPGSTVPLELKDAVRQAVSRHPAIADAVATLWQQEGGVDVARAGYYPKVRVGLGGGDDNGITANGSRGVVATASVSQTLYDFGKTSGTVDYSEALLRRQQAAVLRQIDLIAQQTAEAVSMTHRYQSLLEIAAEQVDAVEKVLETAKLRAHAGLSPEADPIQAESRVDGARANYLQVKSQYAQWRERLRTLIGGPVPQTIALLPETITTDLTMEMRPDTSHLPEVLMALADRKAAEAQLAIAKSQRYPTISLDASVNRSMGGINPNTYANNGTYHSVMLNVTGALYQGRTISRQISSAAAAEAAALQRVETARLNAGDQARGFRERAIGAEDRLGVLAARKQRIIEARDLYHEQYTLGTRSILDLLNAEQEIHQAAADEETVRHDLWDSRLGYIGATGQARQFYGLQDTTVQGMELSP